MSNPSDRELRTEFTADPMLPDLRGDFITSVAHYYRAEITRMIAWRDRQATGASLRSGN